MVLADRILLFLLQRLPYTIAKNWDDYPIPYIQFESITETEHPQAGQSSPCFESSRFVALIPDLRLLFLQTTPRSSLSVSFSLLSIYSSTLSAQLILVSVSFQTTGSSRLLVSRRVFDDGSLIPSCCPRSQMVPSQKHHRPLPLRIRTFLHLFRVQRSSNRRCRSF